MDHDLEKARTLHRQGRLADAEQIYRALLAADPQNAEAMHLLGLIAIQTGQLDTGIELLQAAATLLPNDAELWLNLGEARRRKGDLDAALVALQRGVDLAPANAWGHYLLGVALAARPQTCNLAQANYQTALILREDFPEAHNNFGLLLLESGRPREALAHFQRAAALRPNYPEALINLGNAFWELGEMDSAIAAFEKAAMQKPDLAAAHANLGRALRKTGRRDAALAAFSKARQLDPASPEILTDTALALIESGRHAEAQKFARLAIESARDDSQKGQAWHLLAVPLAAAGQTAEACAAFEKALQLCPNTPEWQFELAALRGLPTRHAPPEFVRKLFDEYAPRFESHLVDHLAYNVPADLLAAVRQCNPASHAALLDLGCGTGLCGRAFRPLVSKCVGVDLSPRMAAIARATGAYDQVIEGDVTAVMRQFAQKEECFDLITAGDLFIYVGALEEPFAAAADVMHPGALLAFSLEHHDGNDFILHARQRFAHSLAYVRKTAAAAGLREMLARQAVLRRDVPPGWIVVLQKPPAR